MNLSISNYRSNISQLNKVNRTPAFKAVITYERSDGSDKHTVDSRFIGSISSSQGGKGSKISFIDEAAAPFNSSGYREIVDSVDISFDKMTTAYKKALSGINVEIDSKGNNY